MQFRFLFFVCFMLASALMVSASPTLKALPCLLGRVKGLFGVKGHRGYGSKEYRGHGSREYRGSNSREYRGSDSREYRGSDSREYRRSKKC